MVQQACIDHTKEAILALMSVPGIGPVTIDRLVGYFGGAEQVLSASRDAFLHLPWLKGPQKQALLRGVDPGRVELAKDKLQKMGAWVIHKEEACYPHLLKAVYPLPVLLFGLGDAAVLNLPCVAIVGSRRPTSYGTKVAFEIARDLAGQGVCIVSGMAMGIDASAHRGALDAGGKTIAVLGCGIDRVYPARNNRLKYEIAKNGAVITEFFPGTAPEPGNFPQRNRIVSGLCLGVVVVEAGFRSGSLITASLALEQGREVMAVPGSVRSFLSKGTHWLLKQGAVLVEDAQDVMNQLGLDTSMKGHEPEGTIVVDEPKKQRILESLGPYPVHIDEIAQTTGIDAGEVAAVLVELELEGLVEALPGKFFQTALEIER